MRSKLRVIIVLLLSLMASATSAAISTTMTDTGSTSMTVYCPKPSDLKKDPVKLTWSADRNSFRSDDISFAKRVDAFSGAQWVGATVGQITCVYNTFPKRSFPILLIFHTLALAPSGGNWSKDLGGYRNCDSLDRKQCAFTIRIQQKQTDIYQEAEHLKSTSSKPFAE